MVFAPSPPYSTVFFFLHLSKKLLPTIMISSNMKEKNRYIVLRVERKRHFLYERIVEAGEGLGRL